jgi:CheY-like chemotaxis protein
VTKQEQQQDAIAPPSLEDYRLLVESIVDYGVFLLDPMGRVASWKRGAQRIKGYEPHQSIGRHFSTFYAAEALTMLRRQPPDLLVSDLGMPDEDSLELMRQVRALDAARGVSADDLVAAISRPLNRGGRS